MIISPLPGGSPGPHANIPAPWRLIIIGAGLLAIVLIGLCIQAALRHADEERNKSIEQWSLEWDRGRVSRSESGAAGTPGPGALRDP